MSYNDINISPVSKDEYLEVIGKDYRKLPEPVVHPYDPEFFQEMCGDHDGYVLHPLTADSPERLLELATAVHGLVTADEDMDIDDHDLGTLSDDYTGLNELINSVRNPSIFIRDVSRHVICGPWEGIIGRLDYQPALIRSEDSPEMEVTMWIADPFRQRNVASYILNRFVNDMFHERSDLLVLRTQVLAGSVAARKLVEQAGFVKEGMIFEDDLEPYQGYKIDKPSEY